MSRIILTIFFTWTFVIQYGQNDSTRSVSGTTTSTPDTLSGKKHKKKPYEEPAPPVLGEVFKPKISLGAGMMSFYGDVYSKHYQAPWTSKLGYDLNVSQRLSRSFQLNLNVLFGKLGANEWTSKRQVNFQSEIRSGGVSLLYDFGNLIPDKYKLRPWVSVGVSSFEFLSKTDLYDNKGNKYYYWSDGSIKNMAEGSPGSQNAVNLVRDYRYESDIREQNLDGFGKYAERAWAFPIGFGALMQVTDRVDLKIGAQYYFTTTDYIDGITSKSVGNRKGNKANDRFVYTSFALQYDLVVKRKGMDTLPDAYFDDVDWLAIDNGDYDGDGVKDWDDKCQCTPKGVPVDQFGCPMDEDKDGVPDYADEEPQTPAGVEVNSVGMALNDDYWQDWYNHYMDSTGEFSPKVIVENFYAQKPKLNQDSLAQAKALEKEYTVELARYTGPVPSDEMMRLLSIGDLKSAILADNTTVVYTSGSFKDVATAVKKRDEFRAEGNKNAQVGYLKNDEMTILDDEAISKLLNSQGGSSTNTATTSVTTHTDAAATNTTSATSTHTTAENPATNGTNVANGGNANTEEVFEKGAVVYRVQLGAYKNRISKDIFKNAGNIVELQTDDGLFRYVTKGFKTINGAAELKANLVLDGYADAFITAYKGNKRIPMTQTEATVLSREKENLDEKQVFSSVNKDLISFKVQLGALRKAGDADFESQVKGLKDLQRQETNNGMVRYTTGDFQEYSKADKYREELSNQGYSEAFVVAIFKGEIISIQEALELLK